MNKFIDLGKYIEIGINALEENFSLIWQILIDEDDSLIEGTA